VRKIAKGDQASKGNRPLSALTQHLQWDHALVSGPVLHDQEYGKEHRSNCEQEDDSPIGPGVRRSRPLQPQYQAQSHRYVYGEAVTALHVAVDNNLEFKIGKEGSYLQY